MKTSSIALLAFLSVFLLMGCPSGEEHPETEEEDRAEARDIKAPLPAKDEALLTENISEEAQISDVSHGDQGVTVLIYHRFGDDRFPSTNIGLEEFEGHLSYLEENDYEVLTFGEAYDRMKADELDEGPYACLTIDDGFLSFYEGAMPLLEEYGFEATLFVNTETVGGGSYMSWDQIKEVEEKGIEIGNHSHSHGHFLSNEDDEARLNAFTEDLETSEELFERNLGYAPDIYAYPYGEYMESFKEVLRENDFRAAAAQHSGVWHSEGDHFAVPRFPMNEFFGTMDRFKDKMSMGPLRVADERPRRAIVEENPPKLELTVRDKSLSPQSFQCFIRGSAENCDFTVEEKEDRIEISAQATEELTARRTNYTITAQNRETRQWNWYTKVWIKPEVPE